MMESFENLNTILPDWVNDKFQKILVQTMNSFKKLQEDKKSGFFFRKWLGINTRAVSVEWD